MNEQATDWMRCFIVREDIPRFAVNTYTNDDGTKHFLNFYITKLKEPDKAGNTHTMYCQEYDAEQKKSIGDKIYIGKCKPLKGQRSGYAKSEETTSSGPTDDVDDLPF